MLGFWPLGAQTLGAATASTGVVEPNAAALTLSGHAPELRVLIGPGIASLTVTGYPPTLHSATFVAPAKASLVVVGHAPNLADGLAPAGADLSITCYAPIVASLEDIVWPASGHLTLTGHASQTVRLIDTATGHLVLTGRIPAVIDIGSPTDHLLAGGEIVERSMILFNFPSGLWGFWTGIGPFEWNGITFHGAGSLIEIEPFEAGSDLASVPLVARLRAVPDSDMTPDVLGTIEDEDYHQRPVTTYTAYFDPDTRALVSVKAVHRGYVDQIEHEEGRDGSYALVCHIESRARDYTKTGYRMRNLRDQQQIFPFDTGLRHAELAGSQEILWGRDKPKKAGSNSLIKMIGSIFD